MDAVSSAKSVSVNFNRRANGTIVYVFGKIDKGVVTYFVDIELVDTPANWQILVQLLFEFNTQIFRFRYFERSSEKVLARDGSRA